MNGEGEENVEPVDDNNFDLIVVGTSLIEGIVACAAARNGKKVLHVDHRDCYGGSYAAFNLSGLIKEHKISVTSENIDRNNCKFASKPVTELAIDGKDPSTNLSTFLSYNYSTKKNFHPSMTGIVTNNFTPKSFSSADSNQVHPAFFGLLSAEKQQAASLLTRDREFCIDTATKTIPGTGAFIDALIASGVSRYLEFKTSDAMFYLISDQHTNSSSIFASAQNSGDYSPLLWRVPCSKNDIFNSKQLSALEKRALMKFHQFVSDWGRTTAGADVTVLNENELAIGRSLYRPQNKAADVATNSSSSLSMEALQSQSFVSFLKSYHLSDKLQNLIMYGLCLLPSSSQTPSTPSVPLSAQKGLQELSLHLNSLGKYGESANLVPIYGLGEIVQGFCRMSAVWAGVYMLRYELSSLTVSESLEEEVVAVTSTAATSPDVIDESSTAEAPATSVSEPPVARAKKIVNIRGVSELERYDNTPVEESPVYTAPRALVHFSYMPQQTFCSPLFSLQMVLVYQGRIFPSERCLTIIPPEYSYKRTDGLVKLYNPFAVHVLQVDASACTVPEGATVLQLHTYIPTADKDQDSFPFQNWIQEAEKVRAQAVTLVREIKLLLENIASPPNAGDGGSVGFSEICSRSMIRPVYDGIQDMDEKDDTILYCGDMGGFSLHLEDEVREAERLYKQLFGQDAVMFNPDGPDPQEEMQLRDDDDDEVEHLYNYATRTLNMGEEETLQGEVNESNNVASSQAEN
jgi:RAB protein geranylgeranyltransferase component A